MGFIWILFLLFALFVAVNKLWCFWCKSKVCLVGKTAIITGAGSGMGYQTALTLASKGCRIIVADNTNVSQAVDTLIKQTHNPHIIGKKIELQSFKSVRAFAKDILETEPRLDILICNAGIADNRIKISTGDGLDRVMQINYFSHFLLTHLLLDLLKKSAPSRIVFTSSVAAYISDMKIEELNPPTEYYAKWFRIFNAGVYSNSKAAMAAAAKLFGEKLAGTGVIANAVHPGGVKTPIFMKTLKSDGNFWVIPLAAIVYIYGKTPEEGAQTLIHVAHSDEIRNITGKSFYEGLQVPRPLALTDKFCKELWEASIKCTGLEPHEIRC